MKHKETIALLQERIRQAKLGKERIVKHEEVLLDEYHQGIINAETYHTEMKRKVDGKTLKEWHEYYDEYIRQGHAKIRTKEYRRKGILTITTIILLVGLFFTLNPYINITGKATSTTLAVSLTTLANSPHIELVNATPPIQGYGLTINITANITDNVGVSTALVEITRPDNNAQNYTMNTDGTLYYYEYHNWTNGTYNYTIYANDTNGDWNQSGIYNFTLQQNLTIQAQTLKAAYAMNEQVNLTDPPG